MAPTLVGSQYDYVILTVKITGWTMFKIHVYVICIASRDMLLYSLRFYIDLTMRDQKCLGIFFFFIKTDLRHKIHKNLQKIN